MEDNFFCFDSDNLETAVTKLYGYGICEEGIIIDGDGDYSNLSSLGAYVLVEANENTIKISQDYIGSYGLYYYRENDYFAISNSFLKLMEYLRDNHRKITFNKPYADYYIASELASNLSSMTLVNEIEMLAKDLEIIIDKKAKEISFNEFDLNESSVPINSKEALDILDNWFYRWVDVIRSIRKQTNTLTFDLSGGIDSRMVAAIWLNANIDLTKIRIFSANNFRFKDEFAVVSKVADRFNFKLNNDIHFETSPIEIKDYLINIEHVKFGFEKERFIYDFTYAEPFFRISGHCGEILRIKIGSFLFPELIEDHIDYVANHAKNFEPSLESPSRTLLNQEFKDIFDRFSLDDKNTREAYLAMYKHARCRHHYGKEFVDSFLSNKFTIAPLSDSDLQKIDFQIGIDDDNLLVALIFKRYCPELLEIEFYGNRVIKQETLDFCDEINTIKEFEPREYEFIEGPEAENLKSDKNLSFRNNIHYIQDIFNSLEFKKEFEKYYPEDLYNNIRLNSVKFRKNNHDIMAAIEVVKAIHDVKTANITQKQDLSNWLVNFEDSDNVERNEIAASVLCDAYSTSRIDIKNRGGNENAVEVIENSDESSNVSFPNWMSNDEGKGCIIKSKRLNLDLKVKSIGDGELNFTLRGVNLLDKNKKRFPVYINYTNFTVDGEEIFNGSEVVTHDDSYSFKMPVKDSQIVNVHVEWMPFSSSCEYENKKIASLERKIRELEAEKRDLESKTNGSKFSKLMSKL